MNKIYFLIITLSFTMLLGESKYKEPEFTLVSKDSNIEIREYSKYVVAKTSRSVNDEKNENNMFRTLASYIFGDNHDDAKIPMTAPVTTFKDNNTSEMIFYMLDADSIDDLPYTDVEGIDFDIFTLGKCATVSFSWFTSDKRVKKYESQLKDYLKKNNITTNGPFMLNRYDPPWKLPFLRRNEIIVRID
tara:strand:- start:385 stop:951 length:567 start_codon:yes stop_codon:yes gene_type:complete